MGQNRMHIDFLEKKYGDISINIIKQEHGYRLSYMVNNKNKVVTYAICRFFKDKIPKSFEKKDLKIKQGGIIGKELLSSGIKFEKRNRASVIINIPEWLKLLFRSEEKITTCQFSEFLLI